VKPGSSEIRVLPGAIGPATLQHSGSDSENGRSDVLMDLEGPTFRNGFALERDMLGSYFVVSAYTNADHLTIQRNVRFLGDVFRGLSMISSIWPKILMTSALMKLVPHHPQSDLEFDVSF
jgi:hypothetical protein